MTIKSLKKRYCHHNNHNHHYQEPFWNSVRKNNYQWMEISFLPLTWTEKKVQEKKEFLPVSLNLTKNNCQRSYKKCQKVGIFVVFCWNEQLCGSFSVRNKTGKELLSIAQWDMRVIKMLIEETDPPLCKQVGRIIVLCQNGLLKRKCSFISTWRSSSILNRTYK